MEKNNKSKNIDLSLTMQQKFNFDSKSPFSTFVDAWISFLLFEHDINKTIDNKVKIDFFIFFLTYKLL